MAGLLDFMQSASNAAADTVAAPVDLIAAVLGKAGLQIDAPVGGSEWMRRKGLRRNVEQSAASLAGETAGLLSPVVAAAKAPQIARGLLQAADNLAAPRTLNPQTGAIVWHGSPHKFDKFDSSKIGTGEGAQAYGHGLYLAENQAVADGYRKGGHVNPDVLLDGEGVLNWALGRRDAVQKMPIEQQRALRLVIDHKDIAQAKRAAEMDGMVAEAKFIDDLASSGRLKPGDPGSLYKVDLPDSAISRMLDWDKPLSQQAPDVQKAMRQLAESGDEESIARWLLSNGNDPKASALFKASGAAMPGVDQMAAYPGSAQMSDALRQMGVPGIRYLDGGSRGAGSGTSNFVVFPGEENILTILERNGIRVGN